MKAKADEKNARAGRSTVKLVASQESLLAKLWHAVLCTPSGGLAPSAARLDPDLSRATWPRCHDARAGTHEFDEHYVRLWRERYAEYGRRERELRGERGEGTPIDDDDRYWDEYRALVVRSVGS